MMKRSLSIFTASLLLAAAGMAMAMAGPQADLSLDRNRMFFRYQAPGFDSGDFQVIPNNRYNPIVLPCNVEAFGGQLDIDYLGAGPTAFPQFAATLFVDQTNQQIVSNGCKGDTVLPQVAAPFAPITAGSVQTDGYWAVSSTNVFCQWLFQPHDLPADTLVRLHISITGYQDDPHTTLLADPDPSNNARDIYVRRACSCQ